MTRSSHIVNEESRMLYASSVSRRAPEAQLCLLRAAITAKHGTGERRVKSSETLLPCTRTGAEGSLLRSPDQWPILGFPCWVSRPSYTFVQEHTDTPAPPRAGMGPAINPTTTSAVLPGQSFVLRSDLNRTMVMYRCRGQRKAESGFGSHRLISWRLLDAGGGEATPAT